MDVDQEVIPPGSSTDDPMQSGPRCNLSNLIVGVIDHNEASLSVSTGQDQDGVDPREEEFASKLKRDLEKFGDNQAVRNRYVIYLSVIDCVS